MHKTLKIPLILFINKPAHFTMSEFFSSDNIFINKVRNIPAAIISRTMKSESIKNMNKILADLIGHLDSIQQIMK